MWKRKKSKQPKNSPTSQGNSSSPPSIPEQKRLRQADHSIVPHPPFLWLTKAIDISCDHLPIIQTLCPSDKSNNNTDGGGWRSALPYGWGSFPHGKLSHSFDLYFGEDIKQDVTFEDFLKSPSAVPMPAMPEGAGGTSPYFSSGGLKAALTNGWNFAFHTSSTTLSDLSNPLALTVLFVLVMILRTIKKIALPKFSALGRKLGRSAHGPNWEHDNMERIVKFGEYVYRLFYHSFVSIYGVCYFWDKPWWNNHMGGTKHLFLGFPNHTVDPGTAWYYLVQCAYNVDALVSLVELSFCVEWVNPLSYSSALEWEDEKKNGDVAPTFKKERGKTLFWTPLFQVSWSPTVRGDFREMMAHHIVTNALIFGSSYYRLTRIGSMIFLIHDLSDVPIDMSKLANFVKWKTTTIVCFVGMVLMWIITRLTIFPFVICRSVVVESYEYLVNQGNIDPALYGACYPFFYFLLGSLVLLHVTWFLILLRIGWTLVRKGETHDYSEHKSGEDQGKRKKN